MSNGYVRDLMIYYYGEKCWLGGVVSSSNPLTYHHIKPVREGGRTTMENGALLSLRMHELFNILESQNQELADEINSYFLIYRGTYPDVVYFRIKEIMSGIDLDYKPKYKNQKKISNYKKCLRKRRR